jgi:hypothetical protein
MEDEKIANDFIKNEYRKIENRLFLSRIIGYPVAYLLVTLWLNSIRETASLTFVWILIIIQFAFYFSIFITSYKRSNILGFNKNITSYIFIILTFLGRINNWELIVIPILVLVMIIISSKSINMSKKEATTGNKIIN